MEPTPIVCHCDRCQWAREQFRLETSRNNKLVATTIVVGIIVTACVGTLVVRMLTLSGTW